MTKAQTEPEVYERMIVFRGLSAHTAGDELTIKVPCAPIPVVLTDILGSIGLSESQREEVGHLIEEMAITNYIMSNRVR